MQLERVKNTKINLVFGLLNKTVIIVLPYFIRMVIIQVLGAEYLGLNSLFASILQVLNLTELGFSSAVVQSMYKPIAENDTDKICALLGFYRKIYKIIGIIITVVGIILIPFLPYLIKGECPDDLNIYVLYVLYLANTAISYLMFAYKNSLLNAFQRTSVISNISTVVQSITYVAQIVLLCVWHNYYLYLLMLPLASILNNICVSVYVNKHFPQYVCKGTIAKEDMTDIVSKVKGLMVYKLCATTRNSFDSIFISIFIGLTATAIYSNYFYVVSAMTTFVGIITNAILAGVGNSLELESVEKNYNDMEKFDFMYMLISGWIAIVMFCLYQPFVKLSFGEDMLFPTSIAFLFALYFYEMRMGDIRATYSDAAGLWWENRYRTIAESITNLILNFILVQFLGVYGIIFATLISLFIFGFSASAHVLFKCYFKNIPVSGYFKNHAIYAIITLGIGAITYFLCTKVFGNNWMVLIVRGIICCIVPTILYVIVYWKTKRFQDVLHWGWSVMKK